MSLASLGLLAVVRNGQSGRVANGSLTPEIFTKSSIRAWCHLSHLSVPHLAGVSRSLAGDVPLSMTN